MTVYTVLYPEGEGKKFDADYYCHKHLPMVKQQLGDVCLGISCELGVLGIPSLGSAPYRAIGYIFATNADDLRAGMRQYGKLWAEDCANFTDIQPIGFIGEMLDCE